MGACCLPHTLGALESGMKDFACAKQVRRARNLKRVKRAASVLFKNLRWVPLRLDVPDSVRFDERFGTNGFVDQAALIARTIFKCHDITIRLAVGTRYGADDEPSGRLVNKGAQCITYSIRHTDGDAHWLHADTMLLSDIDLFNERSLAVVDHELKKNNLDLNVVLLKEFLLHVDNTRRITT